MTLLRVSGIQVQEKEAVILKDISFRLQENQKIAIAGETGSGKSTLLQTIAGLVQPASGEVWFNDEKVRGPHDVLVPGHPEIAYLSQQFELPQFLRVEQVLSYSNTLTDAEAETLYEVCRITHLLKRKTNQLSGGERQRIALARLLSAWPSLLLLDEPYSNLDMGHKSILKSVIHDISDELGITCVLISHDPLDTLSWADEILIMQEGQLIQQGTPQAVYRQPVNAYAASLFGKYNLLPLNAIPVLPNLPGIKPDGKRILVRPENLKIASEDQAILSGTISAVNFFGSYYELLVQLPETSVLVRISKENHREGETVYLTVKESDLWLV